MFFEESGIPVRAANIYHVRVDGITTYSGRSSRSQACASLSDLNTRMLRPVWSLSISHISELLLWRFDNLAVLHNKVYLL
jgi:hypothetical protein